MLHRGATLSRKEAAVNFSCPSVYHPIAEMAYCANCEDLVDFSVQDEIIEENFHGKQIRYPFQTGRCKCCRNEVPTDLGYNARKADAKWKAYTEVRKKEI